MTMSYAVGLLDTPAGAIDTSPAPAVGGQQQGLGRYGLEIAVAAAAAALLAALAFTRSRKT